MKEVGEVVRLDKNRAIVKVDKKDECSKCGMCLFPKGASSIELDSYNEVNAKVGDKVIIESKESSKLLGAMLVFLVPLILIGLSIFFAYVVIGKEIWSLFLSLIFIVVWYIILSVIDNKLKRLKSFSPEIIMILHNEGENKDE